jgi:SAM-dependent methyltransferase
MSQSRYRDRSSEDPTNRFTDRAKHYVQARPDYPPELLEFFQQKLGLSPSSRIADVGSGTGLLTRLLLQSGAHVIGIEPNRAMRSQAEATLANEAHFQSLEATAEATGLPDGSIYLITAGAAFHWFNHARVKSEFARILAPGGWVAIVNNERRKDSGFGRDFEDFSNKFRRDGSAPFGQGDDRGPIAAFFAPNGLQTERFDHFQMLDFGMLHGLVLSRSHSPLPGDARYEEMLTELRRIFDEHQGDGEIRMEYDTRVFLGRL